jgi:hypothetical protein
MLPSRGRDVLGSGDSFGAALHRDPYTDAFIQAASEQIELLDHTLQLYLGYPPSPRFAGKTRVYASKMSVDVRGHLGRCP